MRRRTSATAAGIGFLTYGVLAACCTGRPGRHEQRVFRRLNRDLGSQPWMRVPQQLGTPWAFPAVAVIAGLRGERRLAAAAVVALPVEKGIEVGTKKLVRRPRPAQVLAPALRDDAPTDGPSYPSGHAAIAMCAVWLLSVLLPLPATLALGGCALLTGVARVQQGAHHPADVVGGAALGSGVGALLLSLFCG
ncbi:MAG: phosphatase PAP2 family protein [Marmoricola sp.]